MTKPLPTGSFEYAMTIGTLARMVVHQRGDEMELEIGRLEIGAALQEGAGFSNP